MYMNLLINLIWLTVSQWAVASAQCYAPDGTPSPGYGYLPCVYATNVTSMCCVLNVTELIRIGDSPSAIDDCLTDGLCRNNRGTSPAYFRSYCTDPTWKSPNCLNACTSNSSQTGGVANMDLEMTPCLDGTWCCGRSNQTSCCDKKIGFQLSSSIPPYAASSTLTIIGTVTATSNPSEGALAPTSSATTVVNTSYSSGVNGLGIGLGVALGVAILSMVVVCFILYRKHQTRKDQQAAEGISNAIARLDMEKRSELQQPSVVHEFPNWKDPVELH